MLPDVIVNILSAATPRTVPTSTGTCFAAGVTQRGSSVKPSLLQNFQDFQLYCGQRLAASVVSDWVETFFAEGGRSLWLSRVFGAGALQASLNLMDNAAAVSLVAKAGILGDADPGTWANGASSGLQVAVLISGSQFQIQTSLAGVIVETSPLFSTQADAIAWANHPQLGSRYITLTLGASALTPQAAAATNLAGGTDGSAVDSTARQGALDRIPKHYGPGQICAPGVTAAADQLAVIAHGVANNRFALLDGADTPTAATLTSAAAALASAPGEDGVAGHGRRRAQLLAPWELIPGLTSLSFRTVPPSARAAAQYAKVDALGNPNRAAAGKRGVSQFVIDLSQPSWDAPTRKTLNEAGVTISRRRYAGVIMTYGLRTLTDQTLDADWSEAPAVRTVMAYAAAAFAIGENYDFDQIDPFGHTLSAFRGDLMDAANALFGAGALWGASPSEAFYVDTSDALNPPANLAQGIMRARTKLAVSPNAEQVIIDVVKTPITQEI